MAVSNHTGLPTLLCSRPRGSAESLKQHRRAVPVPLDALESADGQLPPLRVKNTFLEGAALLSPSLESFYQARAVQTCPSKHAGRILSLFDEIGGGRDSAEAAAACASPKSAATPLAIQTPCSVQTPVGDAAPWEQFYQPWCQLPPPLPSCTYPYAAQMLLPAPVPPISAAPSYDAAAPPACLVPPLLAQQEDYTQRAAMSLATALAPEGSAMQQFTAPTQSNAGGRQPDFAPVADQVERVTDVQAWDASTSSHIPPPPPGPALGTEELPSIGSREHGKGTCNPCAFLHTKGCNNGLTCKHCHLCGPEERKRRRREKLNERRELQRTRRDQGSPHAQADE
mmetsp:Transcript_112591/g.290768  ORF Transcript_112591/g.290768 Transcript_112591/m.290768 type:complete len:340 (-) Transcript_112591:243-1262(-)